ncbi:hypothetical protein PCNPT3_02860 [Psychromonas sp. CNPT3]|uniref:hypothetical protein n=1 Tax=Psychromonas sp. CNPT3 TaxID=314282 RepID=UPI00006E8ACA|nr:hypothetical protein [Psychromonas sp. CNPT3]AGH80514.1 hypothetical protein PCNPT3_02860 [Psychromonas sp. CNPT3]
MKKTEIFVSDLNLNSLRNKDKTTLQSELLHIVKQGGSEFIAEIKIPLLPIISWFNDTNNTLDSNTFQEKKQKTKNKNKDPKKTKKENEKRLNIVTFSSKAFKNPPCKKCPALNKGLCKCALKYFKSQQLQ